MIVFPEPYRIQISLAKHGDIPADPTWKALTRAMRKKYYPTPWLLYNPEPSTCLANGRFVVPPPKPLEDFENKPEHLRRAELREKLYRSHLVSGRMIGTLLVKERVDAMVILDSGECLMVPFVLLTVIGGEL